MSRLWTTAVSDVKKGERRMKTMTQKRKVKPPRTSTQAISRVPKRLRRNLRNQRLAWRYAWPGESSDYQHAHVATEICKKMRNARHRKARARRRRW